ncbi:MAG: NarK/NasA family nitrate transporter [Fimbriimonadales bacterium]|nr:NarK/NasA family nitrate transporter [Fimbriimonadales bacterium]
MTDMSERGAANRVLFLNTLAFTVCFAVWTLYGVLITFLVDRQILMLDKAQVGWLIGIPILSGSVLRLPIGLWTDRYGGKPVYIGVMLFSAISVFLVSFANSFEAFLLGGLAFGTAGAAFAVGIAYSSVWFPKEKQGTALGIFGVGNAGAAVTTLAAPALLAYFTNGGTDLDGWRMLPRVYALALVAMTVIFALFAVPKKVEGASDRTIVDMLQPLRDVRVWRFGLYYFLVFGAFVALAQWLVPYYLNVYGMSLALAGLMASIFSFPSGVIRALGGYISDKLGARTTMYWVLATCVLFSLMLVAPRMDIISPGEGIMAERAGVVTNVTPTTVTVDEKVYELKPRPPQDSRRMEEGTLVFPTFESWQEPAVVVGQEIKKRELVAKGVTHVYFQANVWIFTALVFLLGISMGIGKAAVYKHIPEYFPKDVGVVGGIVGVIGGLGGFFCPILFGYMLKSTGVWTTCWLFLAFIGIISLVWMHMVILKMTRGMTPPGPLDKN